jgi:very-short-patch-repair endonuclease
LRPAPTGDVDVTVVGGHKSRRGIRVHKVRRLHPDDCTLIDGIPVTSLERTLLDYSQVAGEQWTRLAIEAAQRQDGLDAARYEAMLAGNPGRATGILRAMMSQVADEPPWTQPDVERRLLAALRGAGLPEPQVNTLIEGELVDMYWRRERLVVEVDGDFWHRTPAARDRDRRRDVKLHLSGRTVARFGDGRVSAR